VDPGTGQGARRGCGPAPGEVTARGSQGFPASGCPRATRGTAGWVRPPPFLWGSLTGATGSSAQPPLAFGGRGRSGPYYTSPPPARPPAPSPHGSGGEPPGGAGGGRRARAGLPVTWPWASLLGTWAWA